VRSTLKGDREAFGVLVEKYQKPVFNVAFRMSRSYADAEDIAQATFLKAFEKLHTYNEQYKFFSWLYRIAVNESLNFLKHQNRFESFDGKAEIAEPTLESGAEANGERRALEESLMELRVDYRAVIILKHFDDMSYEEIGQILEISEKKVKSRLFSARQLLRESLTKKGLHRHA